MAYDEELAERIRELIGMGSGIPESPGVVRGQGDQ